MRHHKSGVPATRAGEFRMGVTCLCIMRACAGECVQVNNQGIQLQGNPTGGGESHLFIKPNLRVGTDQIAGAAAPAKQPSNVQISVGDGKNTATEQLQVLRCCILFIATMSLSTALVEGSTLQSLRSLKIRRLCSQRSRPSYLCSWHGALPSCSTAAHN